jgi:hypothetical protein
MQLAVKSLLVLSLILAAPCLTWSQIRSGTITGVATDASRGVVPGAEVTVVNQDTNVSQATETNSQGEYTVPYLAAGRYKVSVRKSGFKAYEQTDITLTTGQSLRIDVALATGAVESSVEVVANAVQVQSEAASVQGTVDSKVIEALPNITQSKHLLLSCRGSAYFLVYAT